MEKQNRICHELKTDRVDIAQPLPGALRVLPILFYFSIAATIALNALFAYQRINSEKSMNDWTQKAQAEEATKASVKKQKDAINLEVARANDVVEWINGAAPLQPLALEIARSMDQSKSTISNLDLSRDNANPNQIRLKLDFSKGGQKQLDFTLERLQELGYRQFNAVQSQGDNGTSSYQATLIKTNNQSVASAE
jgi:hypothetical protein